MVSLSLKLANLKAIKDKTVICDKKALVVATAISIPALVYITLVVFLAIDEPTTLMIPSESNFSSLTLFKQAIVSAVSPDCEIKITKVFLLWNIFW